MEGLRAGSLLDGREPYASSERTGARRALFGRAIRMAEVMTVRTYVNDRFDCSGKRHRVSVLVSALLLEYPLDLAKFACGFA